MKTVWIYKGLPASGKTTHAKEKVAKSNCAIKRVNKDDLRAMLDSGRHSGGNEKFVLDLRNNIIRMTLNRGKHIIIDDTNFNPIHEESIRKIAKEYNAEVKVKFFYITPEEAIKRDLQRPNSVGAKVIWDMYNTYLKPKEEVEKGRELLVQDSKLPHAIICDLDGTLAIHQNRSPFEYDKCETDLVNETVRQLLYRYDTGYYDEHGQDITLIFLSGREDSCRDKTLKWLDKEALFIEDSDLLLMRKTGDHRKDCIIKKEIFDREIRDKYYIDFVLDDRNQVVQMWRDLGLICLQVADGNF